MADYSWLERVHPLYDRRLYQDTYAWDHYTGYAKDRVLGLDQHWYLQSGLYLSWRHNYVSRLPQNAVQTLEYLRKRSQGEHVDAFKERKEISRFPMHMSRIVNSFTGGISQVAPRAEREYGVLGDPADEGTVMSRLWRNIDRKGTNAEALFKSISNHLTIAHRVIYLVTPPRAGTPQIDPKVELIPYHELVDWYADEDGRMQWALRRQTIDPRDDPKVDEHDQKPYLRYTLYTLEGIEVYHDVDGVKTKQSDLTYQYPFYADDRRSERRLPLGVKDLGFEYHVGYRTADDCNHLYNLLSDNRMIIRKSSGSKWVGDVDDNVFKNTIAAIADGHNFLQGAWTMQGPDAAYIAATYAIYMDETKDVYQTIQSNYESQAAQRTATEIRQEQSQGRFSMLSLLSESLDEIENDIGFLFSQVVAPNNASAWNDYHVERSQDFSVLQPLEERDKQAGIVSTMTNSGMALPQALDFARVPEDEIGDYARTDNVPMVEQ